MDDLSLPGAVSYLWLLTIFVLALVAFHAAFVWARPLGKIGWKKVDYFWLTFALLGALGGTASARQFVASSLESLAEERIHMEAAWILESINSGTSEGVCRQFVRSEYSPSEDEFIRVQREFDSLCAWFKDASQRAPAELSAGRPITAVDLGGTPPPHGADHWYIETLVDRINRYNTAIHARSKLASAAKPSEATILLMLFGPYLIAIALALRITKVTGEIRLG